jgi:hypothetical protein
LTSFAVAFAAIGVGLAALIVQGAASSGKSYSESVLTLVLLLPLFGLYAACWATDLASGKDDDPPFDSLGQRIGFICIGGAAGAATMYLAFVVTSGAWYAESLPADERGFLYLVFHPGVLPELTRAKQTGLGQSTPTSSESWIWMTMLGLIVGLAGGWYVMARWVSRDD